MSTIKINGIIVEPAIPGKASRYELARDALALACAEQRTVILHVDNDVVEIRIPDVIGHIFLEAFKKQHPVNNEQT